MVENGKILRYLKFLHGLNPGRTILVVPQNHLTVGTEPLVKRGCGVFAIARLDKQLTLQEQRKMNAIINTFRQDFICTCYTFIKFY